MDRQEAMQAIGDIRAYLDILESEASRGELDEEDTRLLERMLVLIEE